MHKLIGVCLASLFAILAPPVLADSLGERLDALISPFYHPAEPGAAVIVIKDGKTVLRKAYGLASVAPAQALSVDMSLRLASVSKQFTAVAIGILADEGKLSVTDDITRFLPDYPVHGKKITIDHLLTHTSGIVNYTAKPGFDATRQTSVAQVIDSFKRDKLEFEPGTRFAYNNSGYFLLGAIIEKASGQTYAKFLEERIFVPLGMTQSAYEGQERGKVRRAAGHTRTGTGYTGSAAFNIDQSFSIGSLVSTVDDLARWDAAIGAGQLLTPATWRQFFTPYVLENGTSTAYGRGWALGELQGSPVAWHNGEVTGYSSYALRLPEEKVFVAVLSNADSGVALPEVIARRAAAIVIGKPYPDFKEIKLDAKALDAFTGVYRVDDQTTRTITRDGGRLHMRRNGRAAAPLYPYSATGFYLANSMTHMQFAVNAQGEATHLTLYQRGTEETAKRDKE